MADQGEDINYSLQDGQPKKPETQFEDLENEIEQINCRLQLFHYEEATHSEERQEKIKAHQNTIKELKEEIDRYQISIGLGKYGDEKILKKAFKKYPYEMRVLSHKDTGKVVDILEERVFDMVKKRDLFRYELGKKQKEVASFKEQLRQLEHKFFAEEEQIMIELEKARDLENDLQSHQMRILELQEVQRIYLEISVNLEEDTEAYPQRLNELKEEFKNQSSLASDIDDRLKKAKHALKKAESLSQVAEKAALAAHQDKEEVIGDFNQIQSSKALSSAAKIGQAKKNAAFTRVKLQPDEDLENMKEEQENLLKNYKEIFEKIKASLGVTKIEDAAERILSQKIVFESLNHLKKLSDDLLIKYKDEKKQHEMRKQTLEAALLITSQKVLYDQRKIWERASESQVRRLQAAGKVYDLISKILGNSKASLCNTLNLTEDVMLAKKRRRKNYTPSEDERELKSEISLTEITGRLLKMTKKMSNRLKGIDIAKLKRKMKKDLPFLKKMDKDIVTIEEEVKKSSKEPAETEKVDSDNEDELQEQRAIMISEARNFAEIKEKQKMGRGRGGVS